MELRHAYKILGLRFGADLDTVKSAFRKQAFAYHPDLHPDDPQAARKFHDLNQAYVHLKAYLAAREGRTTTKQQSPPRPKAARPSQDPPKGFAARQEETLKDILNDPFARQVFEDIFEKIKSRKPRASTRTEPTPHTHHKKLSLSWGSRSLDLDVTNGFFSGMKKWMGSQLDDHHTIRLPAPQLRPGSMVRVHINRKGKGTQALDLRLPHNFIVGRPIRLKGQGRAIGPLKGDLYLRFLAV
ncbi:MAG: molecular chaperone DnaJ [Deltaproteobacteria bacterium]|nr:MAG: molecular chaperone DnaJ [Deltaproteobacteria bacterium]